MILFLTVSFFILAAISTGRDQVTYLALCCLAAFNVTFSDGAQLAAAWECLTVLILLFVGGSAAGRQILILSVAWCAHVALLADLRFGTSIIYNHYEIAMLAISLAQIGVGIHGARDGVARAVDGLLASCRFAVSSGVHSLRGNISRG